MIMVEKSFLKRFYTRILFNSLWALEGLVESIPEENDGAWTGFQVLLKYQL
jgi:hypothetical protein